VDRAAQHRHDPNGFAICDQVRQERGLKSVQAIPQADVRGKRRLRLHADEVDQGRLNGQVNPAKQELPIEEGAVERPLPENVGHGRLARNDGCIT
jgi:hypothetical protein